MKNEYREVQTFRDTIFLKLGLAFNIVLIFILLWSLYTIIKVNSGDNINAISILIISILFLLLLIWLLFKMSLVVEINKDEISYRFIPFHRKNRVISIREIKFLEVIKYSPIGDYGGYGIRYSWNGKAYNVKGNFGLKIHFEIGKPILLGTQKPEELKSFIRPILDSYL